MHGVDVFDPYRNLENVRSPETQRWLKAEGQYAAEQLSRIEGRAEMARRVEILADSTGDEVRGVLRLPGTKVFYLKRNAGESQFKLIVRDGLAGAERVLVDPERMTAAIGRPHAIDYFVPSWDGLTLAYGMS
ncbi:MAG: S9 family peptidase, partial [Caldimonas sp.]